MRIIPDHNSCIFPTLSCLQYAADYTVVVMTIWQQLVADHHMIDLMSHALVIHLKTNKSFPKSI